MEAGNLLSPSTWPQETTPYSAQPENTVVGSSFGKNKLGVQRDCTGFSGGSVVKNLPANAGDEGSIPGLERSPGGGRGIPLRYSCLENPIDRGDWWATVHRVAKSQT